MSRCKLFCADSMVVGRWYKLLTYPTEINEDITTYTATYKCSELDIAYILHDTVYIKNIGIFTISVQDMYGNTDEKTIIATNEDKIDRLTYKISPRSWEDLREKIENIGECAYISISRGIYDFEVNETGIDVPTKTIIDFNGSTINVSSAVDNYKGFRFSEDYSGIKNAIFNGVDMGIYTYYSDQCALISIICGKFQKIENLTFNNVAGFNITIGIWPNYWDFKPSYESGRWLDENNFAGYVNDSGEIQAATGRWTMENAAEAIETDDRSYCVGQSSMWFPATAKTYDIAFYDTDGNFIRLDKDLMFYRKYYYPENTKYFRISICQVDEPTNFNGRDDLCIMRMMGGINGINKFTTVEDLWMDNVICNGHASGGLSVVGVCQDIHINRMKASENGWKNAWAFDIEDSWNSSMGIVISHSYFGDGTVVFHGIQGISMISTIIGSLALRSLIHSPTIINSICSNINIETLRNCLTIINSYSGIITKQEDYEYVYSFGNISQEDAKNMRTIIENVLNN